jgi:hypothetical protein
MRVTDVDGVDERIAKAAADQTDHAIGGQYPGGGEGVPGGTGALNVIHRLHEVIDTKWNGGHQDDTQEFES